VPLQLESLYMGCVSHSLKYFPRGRIVKHAMKEAELAARKELQTIVSAYRETGWEEAVGSSGSAKAIVNASPMFCMPGTLTTSIFPQFERELGVPVICNFYDGSGDPNRALIPMMHYLCEARRCAG